MNCEWNDWGEWSSCSNPCGAGTEQRKRSIKVNALNGGASCWDSGSDHETRSCQTYCETSSCKHSISS